MSNKIKCLYLYVFKDCPYLTYANVYIKLNDSEFDDFERLRGQLKASSI